MFDWNRRPPSTEPKPTNVEAEKKDLSSLNRDDKWIYNYMVRGYFGLK